MSKRQNGRKLGKTLSAVLALTLLASSVVAPVPASGAINEKNLANYTKSYMGNNYPGIGGNEEPGLWVQHMIDNADFVNGTVITAAHWDEAGRCTGLYRDGEANYQKVRPPESNKPPGWAWGTGSYAVAGNKDHFWIFSDSNHILHFEWDYTDVDSARFIAHTGTSGSKVISLSEKNNRLYALRENGWIEVRDGINMGTKYADFQVNGAKALAVNPKKDEVWVVVGNEIKKYNTSGSSLGTTITDAGKPVNVSFDEQNGYLVVCDDSERQQLRFYDVSKIGVAPTLVKTFGQEGGLDSGIPGEDEPDKFYALKAAGTDEEGNIYVCMAYGTAVIRKFRPDGVMVWERAAYNFTDCTDFMPGTDGTVIYGADEIFELDYSKGEGEEATVTGITTSLLKDKDRYYFPADKGADLPRSNVWIRNIQGKRVLFMNSMAVRARDGEQGRLDMYVFDDDETMYARFVRTLDHGATMYPYNWAFDIDEDGTIWLGEISGAKIRAIPFQGYDNDGNPVYDLDHPINYNRPGGWNKIERIIYDEHTDMMYLSGFTPSHTENTWGCVGHVMRAYKWNNGNAQQKWELVLPSEDEGNGNMIPPKSIDIAGDYIFMVTSRSAKVHVFNKNNCNYVGTMNASPYGFGWVDIPYGLKATKRENGEYVILVEDDWRSKNVIYRWTPNGSDGVRFNQDDVNKMKTFLNSNNNLSKLEGWDINEPASWKGVSWKEVNGERRLSEIILANKKVTNAASLANTNATLLVYPENGENVSLLKSSDGSKTLTIKTAGYGYVCGEITNSGEVKLETKTAAGFLKY